uniref:MHC class I-like antigen recognition-like domain-containing protein n=1 Tax=Anolis carolinensis TaxID=28377 RepID=H9GT81_ANOCA
MDPVISNPPPRPFLWKIVILSHELLHMMMMTSCSSHSMLYFVTSVSEPGQQVPQFSYVGFVNDQEFVFYNASTKRYLPKVPWISQVEKDDPDYWERNTLYAQGHERSFRDHLATLAKYYNQSGGSHQLQK